MIDLQIIKADGLARIEGQIPKHIFKDAQENFSRATEVSDNKFSYQIVLGGQRIELVFAGEVLVEHFLPAIKHLISSDQAEVDLSVFLWDSESTGVGLPNSILRSSAYTDNVVRESRLMQVLDYDEAIGLYWVSSPQSIPYYERGSPFRAIFQWWMKTVGMQIMHAGAIGKDGKGVLLVGAGGSGKSTTTLSCIRAGLDYVGDDNCLVALNHKARVYSLYNTLKLDWDNVANFDNLPAPLENSSGVQMEKALFFLHEFMPERLSNELELSAILMPKIVEGKFSRIVPASPIEGLKLIGPSTIFQMPRAGQKAFNTISRMVNSVPLFTLELGSDLDGVAHTLSDFLQ